MPHYLIELYTPKPTWLALGPTERQAFFNTIGAGMQELLALGIEPVSFGELDAKALHATPHTFFGIWKLPSAQTAATLANAIAATGWHGYFETVNAVGSAVNLPGHLAQLAAA